MGADVIQHRKPRRKRASAWSWTTRHLGLLAVALIAVFAASWLAPDMTNRPAPVTPLALPQPALPPVTPETIEVDIRADFATPPPVRVRADIRHTGVPLNAAPALRSDDFEILGAPELDAISQARN